MYVIRTFRSLRGFKKELLRILVCKGRRVGW